MDEKTHPCTGCIYAAYAHGLTTCNYIFIMDKRRPCPPGEACTEKTVDKAHYKEIKKELARKARKRAEECQKKRMNLCLRVVTCPICGTVFKTDDSRKKFCSDNCYTINRRRVWVENSRARREKQKQAPTGDTSKN